MKKYNVSFLLGKFLPPTKGHCYLIDTASKHSEKVYVLMCSLKREPIKGELRFEWLKDIYKDTNVEIIWVTDENPQYPEEDPINFWDIWLTTFNTYLPEKPDAVFSSEDYGFEIAKRMGIEHFLVDKERVIVPICATKIREDAHKYWDYIPDVVKPYFVKKITILGTESSGKSTLCKRLAEHFETNWVSEYGRYYTESIKEDLDIQDFYNIAEGQKNLVNIEVQKANKLLLCDTELITTKIFSKLYCPQDYNILDSYFENEIKNQKYDLYILLDKNTEFVQDGNRRFEEKRSQHYGMIKLELAKNNIAFHEVSGDNYDDKFNRVVEIIKEFN
jgi:HTH-type transcriptional repressor of NAD biosynthesis genes